VGGGLDHAVRAGKLATNPATWVDLPRLPTTERRYLSHEQVTALSDAAGHHRTLVLLLAYTGLRWGEAAALKVRRVDLLHGRIQVAEAMTEVSGRALFGSTKTHSHRSVPVPRFLRDDLAQHLAGKAADDLLLTSPAGSVLRVGNWRQSPRASTLIFELSATTAQATRRRRYRPPNASPIESGALRSRRQEQGPRA
jgi:integrase